MRLFYGAPSPFARIVRVALLETGLDARVHKQEVTLRDPTSALLPHNPVGRVPTLELDEGTILTESLLILSYIDTLHAGCPLLPRDGSDGWRTLAAVQDGQALRVVAQAVSRHPHLRRQATVGAHRTFRQPGGAGSAARSLRAQKQPVCARRRLSTIGGTSRHPGRHHRGRPQARASHLHDADTRRRIRRQGHRVRGSAPPRTPTAQSRPQGQSLGLRPCPTVSFLRG